VLRVSSLVPEPYPNDAQGVAATLERYIDYDVHMIIYIA
jgi:hypothetical protein